MAGGGGGGQPRAYYSEKRGGKGWSASSGPVRNQLGALIVSSADTLAVWRHSQGCLSGSALCLATALVLLTLF